MLRRSLLALALAAVPAFAQNAEPGPLVGRVQGNSYVSPTGTFRITIPVLPELGGRILDTENSVTFQDNFNVFCTVVAVPMDATQRWELSTRGTKDYLAFFFANSVMPDFQNTFRGARVESAKFSPDVASGGLFAYVLLPGGSMFASRLAFVNPSDPPPVAKRGNLVFTRHNWVYVLSIELAERVLERSAYHKTEAQQDDILRQRLVELLDRMQFLNPPAAGADTP